jgi:hypothetical protein
VEKARTRSPQNAAKSTPLFFSVCKNEYLAASLLANGPQLISKEFYFFATGLPRRALFAKGLQTKAWQTAMERSPCNAVTYAAPATAKGVLEIFTLNELYTRLACKNVGAVIKVQNTAFPRPWQAERVGDEILVAFACDNVRPQAIAQLKQLMTRATPNLRLMNFSKRTFTYGTFLSFSWSDHLTLSRASFSYAFRRACKVAECDVNRIAVDFFKARDHMLARFLADLKAKDGIDLSDIAAVALPDVSQHDFVPAMRDSLNGAPLASRKVLRLKPTCAFAKTVCFTDAEDGKSLCVEHAKQVVVEEREAAKKRKRQEEYTRQRELLQSRPVVFSGATCKPSASASMDGAVAEVVDRESPPPPSYTVTWPDESTYCRQRPVGKPHVIPQAVLYSPKKGEVVRFVIANYSY